MLEIVGVSVVVVVAVWAFRDNIKEWARPLYVRWFGRD